MVLQCPQRWLGKGWAMSLTKMVIWSLVAWKDLDVGGDG